MRLSVKCSLGSSTVSLVLVRSKIIINSHIVFKFIKIVLFPQQWMLLNTRNIADVRIRAPNSLNLQPNPCQGLFDSSLPPPRRRHIELWESKITRRGSSSQQHSKAIKLYPSPCPLFLRITQINIIIITTKRTYNTR